LDLIRRNRDDLLYFLLLDLLAFGGPAKLLHLEVFLELVFAFSSMQRGLRYLVSSLAHTSMIHMYHIFDFFLILIVDIELLNLLAHLLSLNTTLIVDRAKIEASFDLWRSLIISLSI
jgi:hypothetical protein